MLNAYDRKELNEMRNEWYQFKIERNMPKYQGVESPNWLTVLQRESMIDTLLGFCQKLLKEK
jgi:hypothetical protein